MRITKITALPIRIPLEDSFGGEGAMNRNGAQQHRYYKQRGWRGLYSNQTETTLVRIATDEGISGIGEGQAPIGPQIPASIVESLLAPLLIGRNPLDIEVLRHEMYSLMNIRGHYSGYMLHAIAGVDMALADLRGKALKQPVSALLGGAYRDRVPAYVSGIRGESIDEKLATIRGFLDRGFTHLKTFLGFGVAEDLESIDAFCGALGSRGRLMVDVLWNYDVPSAIQVGRHLERKGGVWLEAPTAPEDLAGHAEVARALDLPVAAGETETTRFQFLPWFERRALDIAQPDVARCGITEAKKIAELAETFHLPVALHSGISLGPAIAASIQVAASIPNLMYLEFQPAMLEISNRFLTVPLRCEQGYFGLTGGHGLGIEIDEEKLAPYVFEPA